VIIRYEYLTQGDAFGEVFVSNQQHTKLVTNAMMNKPGEWHTGEIKVKITDPDCRFIVANREVGEGNTIWVRNITIYTQK
jgi:hypothetical protein